MVIITHRSRNYMHIPEMYVNKQFESSEKQDLNYHPANKRYLYNQIIMV